MKYWLINMPNDEYGVAAIDATNREESCLTVFAGPRAQLRAEKYLADCLTAGETRIGATELGSNVWERYKLLIGPLCQEAKRLGYALAVHGSLSRDIDLIAAPWISTAVPAAELAEALRKVAEQLTGYAQLCDLERGQRYFEEGCPGSHPHGRLAWAFHVGGTYLDISVLPMRDFKYVIEK